MALPKPRHTHDHEDDIDALVARHVELLSPFDTPDDARLVESGARVTVVITQLYLEYWDVDEVARAYDVPVEAVQAAIAYYERHKAVIDARMTLDAASFTGEGQTHDPEAVISTPSLLEAAARMAQERKAQEDALIDRHIEIASAYPTPDEARLKESNASVTAVITELRGNLWDIVETARAFDVSPEAVRAAIMYYGQHRLVIDARMTLNNASLAR